MTTYYLILSAATFIIWGVDKFRARLNQWRVPERILFTLVILGGAFGALAGL